MKLGCRMHGVLIVAVMGGLVGCSGGGNNNVAVQVPVQPVTIDVPSAVVTPSYTVDTGGGPTTFPVSEYDDGNFILRSATSTTDSVLLGSSHTMVPGPVRVVQDSAGYAVLFQHETGAAVPQNVYTPVQTGEVVDSDRLLPIAVMAVNVRPAFTLNTSASFPISEYDDGVFYLQPSAGGERILLGNSHTATPDNVLVMPDTYDVIYSLETAGSVSPNNHAAIVMAGEVINTDRVLTVDVATVDFRFDATLDTAPLPASQYQEARFFLRNNTGDLVELGASFELPVTVSVVAGTYDIVYQHVQGDALPINTDAVVAKDVVVDSGNPTQLIDLTSVVITPAFTLDGGAFPQTEYNDANFYLRGTSSTDDVMLLGASEATPAPVRVLNSTMDTDLGAGVSAFGNYEVLYRHETGNGVPQNSNAVVMQNQLLDMDGPLAINVNTINVNGVFTLNGSSFPADAGNSVQFLLMDANNASDSFHFGFSDITNESVKLIPGTYDVVMDHLDGDAVPQNAMHAVDFNNALNADTTLRVNVPAVRIDPRFTLDGLDFPASIYQSAKFYLREKHFPFGRIFLGRSYAGNDPVMVIQENYDVIYDHFSGEQVPQNIDKFIKVVDL